MDLHAALVHAVNTTAGLKRYALHGATVRLADARVRRGAFAGHACIMRDIFHSIKN